MNSIDSSGRMVLHHRKEVGKYGIGNPDNHYLFPFFLKAFHSLNLARSLLSLLFRARAARNSA
jgi:hypothetical protein